MDAYSSYNLRLAQARASELRREIAEYEMSRATRGSRISLWTGIVARAADAVRRRIGDPRPSPSVVRAD